jgi:hypothetical protein
MREGTAMTMFRPVCAAIGLALASLTAPAIGAPVVAPFPVAGPDDAIAAAAPAFSGRRAVADSFEDTIEIRDIDGALLRTITRAEIVALAPWMTLAGNQDGPCAMAWTDSGRQLYILVFDAAVPGDGLGSDVILRYDVYDDTLIRFARLELASDENTWPRLGIAHLAGRLYLGTASGNVIAYNALSNSSSGSVRWTGALPGGSPVRGIAVDRLARLLYIASDTGIYRHNLALNALSAQFVGALPGIRSLTHSTHFGAPGLEGLFALRDDGAGASIISRIPDNQATGQAAFAPSTYTTSPDLWHSVAATADGALLVSADEDAVLITDSADTRLAFNAWIADEFAEVVDFGKGLISPDGEIPGWVIDADVIPAWNRFHPATPDGAAWVVFLLLMNDHIYADPQAQPLVRDILMRYAGTMPDGIGASRSADGYFRHWIYPVNGGTEPGWPTELATYSTMKLVAAADRAAAFYPTDPDIQEAAREIICGVTNWDGFIQPTGSRGVYLIANPGGGPSLAAINNPFTEGVLFVEQAATYGGPSSVTALDKWTDRAQVPSALWVPGRPVSGASSGSFLASFITIYSELLQPTFRADPTWNQHTENLLVSHCSWTDDNAPEFFTVFSAGTTKGEWGGYNADSLSYHPGNVTTFTSLMGFCARGDRDPAVAAYHAYRNGARQTFKSGASILYRRSAIDPLYDPDSAGLPDVAHGALALAELLAPGSIESVLAIPYNADICTIPPACPGDINGDGNTNAADFTILAGNFGAGPGATPAQGDLTGDGFVNAADFTILAGGFGCTTP